MRRTGNEDLTDVGVTDKPVNTAGGVSPACQSLKLGYRLGSGADQRLAPGLNAIFTVTNMGKGDVGHGSIADTATADGTTPQEQTVSDISDPLTIDVTQFAALSITKSASPTTVSMVGQTIDYTFSVVNTGNVTLTDVGVTDHPTAPATAVTATCHILSSPTGNCSGHRRRSCPARLSRSPVPTR